MVVGRAKPSVGRLRRGHPIARGLLLGWAFTEGAGAIVHDLAGGLGGVLTELGGGADPVWGASRWGAGVTTATGTREVVTAAADARLDMVAGVSAQTMTVVGRIDAFQGGNAFGNRLFAIDGLWGMTLGDSANRSVMLFTYGANSGAQPSGLVDGSSFVVTGVYDQGEQTIQIWVNGRLAYEDTAYGNTSASAGALYAANDKSAANALGGTLSGVWVWGRRLSPAEIRAVSGDPFVLTRAVGGGAGVFAAALPPPPPPGPSGVTLEQSATAGFPDRPEGGGSGLRVVMQPGGDGAYLARDLGVARTSLSCRVMVRFVTAIGGEVVIVRGMDDGGAETYRVVLDTDLGVARLEAAGGVAMASRPLSGLDWHCVEGRVDSDTGVADLWVDGVLEGASAGVAAGTATRAVWIGAPLKENGVTGVLHLDELVLADGAIGPVIVEPRSAFADDARRWLVVFNRLSSDSVAWAEAYRQRRGVPYSNLLGVDASASEEVSEAEFEAIRDEVEAYLDLNGLRERIVGVLLGHGVPGAYVRSDGKREAIAGQMHRVDGTVATVDNGLSPGAGEALVRPTEALLGGNLLAARIDGPDLTFSVGLLDRADVIGQTGLVGDEDDPGGMARVWLDPWGPDDPVYDAGEAEMAAWATGIDGQRTRLPIELSSDVEPAGDVGFDSISNDGFFWGWDQALPPAGFFGGPSGARVFGVQLSFGGVTAPTVRNPTDGSWVMTGLAAGYASFAGGTRDYSVSATPRVGSFFEALRRGWTLGEAWFGACPVLRTGLMLIGDPLMRVPMPRAGWNVYGPMDGLEGERFEAPVAALREPDRSWAVPGALRGAEGEDAFYVLRHVDAEGREETGVAHAARQVIGGVPLSAPAGPIWPVGSGWSAARVSAGWRVDAAWPGRFGLLGIVRVDLIEQTLGGPEVVVRQEPVDPSDRAVPMVRDDGVEPVRLRVIAVNGSGVVAGSGWSRWLTRDNAGQPIVLTMIG